MKDDIGIIRCCYRPEWALVANRDGIDGLRNVERCNQCAYRRPALSTLEWPPISPVDVPVSNMKAAPNL